MNLNKMQILQQSELSYVGEQGYFDEDNPCHIYFICKRPRLTINADKYEISKDYIKMTFVVQEKTDLKEYDYKFQNNFGHENIRLLSEYPHNIFKLVAGEKVLVDAKVGVFVQSMEVNADFLDLEILYIGQSYGVEGERTAPDLST
ncbi:MAG: hypothetical protein LBE79_00040, partial [Tannerella sp.]|jgi:hypothetical protein|nr:hypothetical protein [Tannerella sp.]